MKEKIKEKKKKKVAKLRMTNLERFALSRISAERKLGNSYKIIFDIEKEYQSNHIENNTSNSRKHVGIKEGIHLANKFFHNLLQIVPTYGVLQYRMGFDPNTMLPMFLFVVSSGYVDKMSKILRLTSDIVLDIYRKRGRRYRFLVLVDDEIDQTHIDQDFPYQGRYDHV